MLNPTRRSKGLWWDEGIGLVGGCSPVSPGCANCWRAVESHMRKNHPNSKIRARYEGLTDEQGRWTGEIRPMWDDLAKITPRQRPKVIAIWNDLFHPEVPDEFIANCLLRISRAPQHLILALTKRPERMVKFFSRIGAWEGWITHDGTPVEKIYKGTGFILSDDDSWPLPNLWLGVTAENQEQADRRIPLLLQVPAAVRFVSVEPMLGPVDLIRYFVGKKALEVFFAHGGKNVVAIPDHLKPPPHLDWIICGGETGARARPSHPDWFRRVRDDCQAAGVPFWFKGWGDHKSLGQGHPDNPWGHESANFRELAGFNYGEKHGGRVLDGRTWEEMP